MVDNRSAGVLGVGGGFNFKSGDISGTAAKTSDDKQDQGTEYFQYSKGDEDGKYSEEYFRDRSNELRASLSSLAAINSANIRLRKAKDKKREEEEKKKLRQNSRKELSQAENDAEKN